jgi:hypothetical protein
MLPLSTHLFSHWSIPLNAAILLFTNYNITRKYQLWFWRLVRAPAECTQTSYKLYKVLHCQKQICIVNSSVMYIEETKKNFDLTLDFLFIAIFGPDPRSNFVLPHVLNLVLCVKIRVYEYSIREIKYGGNILKVNSSWIKFFIFLGSCYRIVAVKGIWSWKILRWICLRIFETKQQTPVILYSILCKTSKITHTETEWERLHST